MKWRNKKIFLNNPTNFVNLQKFSDMHLFGSFVGGGDGGRAFEQILAKLELK